MKGFHVTVFPAPRVGSQCTGYGGLEAAIASLTPVQHAWHAETDPAAATVLAHHHPNTPNHGDITAHDWTQAKPVDILTAGIPCQPMSCAGKRRGSSDERHLWPTGALPAIAALMPPLVVLENVPGLLTIERGQIFGQILADLDDLGYTASWTTIGACAVGACHHRHRVFLAATLEHVAAPAALAAAGRFDGAWGSGQGSLFGEPEPYRWPASGFVAVGAVWSLPVYTCGADGPALPTPAARDATRGAGRVDPEGRPLSEVIALLPTPMATNGAGGAKVLNGGRTLAGFGATLRDVAPLLPTPRATDVTKGGPNQRGSSGDLMLPSAVQPERFGRYAAAVHRHEQAYQLAAPNPTEPGRGGRPRLNAAFTEWMQGLPPGWITDHAGRADAIRMAGNGVNPRQAAYALPTLPTFRLP